MPRLDLPSLSRCRHKIVRAHDKHGVHVDALARVRLYDDRRSRERFNRVPRHARVIILLHEQRRRRVNELGSLRLVAPEDDLVPVI